MRSQGLLVCCEYVVVFGTFTSKVPVIQFNIFSSLRDHGEAWQKGGGRGPRGHEGMLQGS